MKTKISLFISACMFFAFSFAQKAVVPDSIHKIKMDSMAKLSGRLMNVDIDSAKAIADRMLKYSEKHHFLRGQAQSLATLGSFYNSQGDKGKALQYFKRTYDIFEALDNHILAHRISILVSELFRQTKDYDQALAYAKKTLQYLEKNKDNRGLARAYHVMALIHEDMGNDFDQVMFYLKKAEAVSRGFIKDTTNSKTQINLNTSELCGILNSQSEVHLKRGKNTAFAIDRANASLKRIKIYNPKDNYFSGKSHVLLGEAHYKQKQYRKALLHNDSSLVAYKAMNYAVGLKEAYKSRKKILVQMGDYQKALDITELAAGYQDSISDVAKEKEFSRMKAEYETDSIVALK